MHFFPVGMRSEDFQNNVFQVDFYEVKEEGEQAAAAAITGFFDP